MQRIAALYFKPGMVIADVTFGRGVFWKRIDLGKYTFLPTDLTPSNPSVAKQDFRDLPYGGCSIDVLVLDPPYMHGGSTVKRSIAKCYRNDSTKDASHKGVIALYTHGLREAYRVLAHNGLVLVKCQDEIESGKQRWSHIEILHEAEALGFEAVDLFVLVQATVPARRLPYQHHARKNHSYLLVLKKPLARKPNRSTLPSLRKEGGA
jgi:hypothetical protein